MTNNEWFCGITSAPRKNPTLASTVTSLQAAGFEPKVFAEPGTIVPTSAMGEIHKNRRGVWRNWVYTVTQAVRSEAEYVLITQDDTSVHPDTQAVLDQLFENPRYKVISTYTPRAYSHENQKSTGRRNLPGVYPISSKTLWGAVGLAYRREVLVDALNHDLIGTWRGVKPARNPEEIVNSDVAIGRILYAARVPVWFPTPSFGVHTSQYSSIPGHGSNDVRRNRNAEEPANWNLPLWDQLFSSV